MGATKTDEGRTNFVKDPNPQAQPVIGSSLKRHFTYECERVLGSGAFGAVYQARVKELNMLVSIKQAKQRSIEMDKVTQTPYEIQCLLELNRNPHPNIMKLYDAFWGGGRSKDNKNNEKKLYLVMEYFPDNLSRILRHARLHKKALKPSQIMIYSYQMCRGLSYMHSLGYSHLDVKPQNLLIDGTDNRLVICDFGTARRLFYGASIPVPYIQSRYYRAPEVLLASNRLCSAADVWSAGVVIAEMILGFPLFHGKGGPTGDDKEADKQKNPSMFEMFFEIQKILGTPTLEDLRGMNHNQYEKIIAELPDFERKVERHPFKILFKKKEVSSLLIDLVDQILIYNPTKRPKMLDILSSRCFESNIFGERNDFVVIPKDKEDNTQVIYPKTLFCEYTPDEWILCDEVKRKLLNPLQYYADKRRAFQKKIQERVEVPPKTENMKKVEFNFIKAPLIIDSNIPDATEENIGRRPHSIMIEENNEDEKIFKITVAGKKVDDNLNREDILAALKTDGQIRR